MFISEREDEWDLSEGMFKLVHINFILKKLWWNKFIHTLAVYTVLKGIKDRSWLFRLY